MKAKTMLISTGALLMVAGIVLAELAMGQAWAVYPAVVGIVAVILVSGVAVGVASDDAFIVAVLLSALVCMGVALHGGVVAEILLEAVGGSVTLAVASAATLAGVGGALFGIGIVRR